MSLFKLRAAPIVLIEDDANKNILPLIRDLVTSETFVNIFCYEHPASAWRNVFKDSNKQFYEEFDSEYFSEYTSTKSAIIIDSINQMALTMGWNECLKCIKRLNDHINVEKIIIVLHTDCLSHGSKMQIHLNHISNAIVSFDVKDPHKVWIKIKKSSKVIKTEEILTYDSSTGTLKSQVVIKQDKKDDEPSKPSPGSLTTFKIEVDQIDKMEKSKLKLPYMSKINAGESKVFYEPDAVDDWDEEDPDEDLDI